MIRIGTVKSAIIESGKRIVKILRLGRSDVQTSRESMPFGVDSHPLKDMAAIQVETGVKGKTIVIGYVNTQQLAEIGEIRIFAADANGVKSFVHCKNNGDVHVNGDLNSAVAYAALNQSMTQLALDINLELTKIATGLAGVGGAYAPTPIQIDISGSEVDTVKLP